MLRRAAKRCTQRSAWGSAFNSPTTRKPKSKQGNRGTLRRGLTLRLAPGAVHYVYISGYTPAGPVCVTWGRKQQMTWAWVNKYCDEAYAIVDAKDTFKKALIHQTKVGPFP